MDKWKYYRRKRRLTTVIWFWMNGITCPNTQKMHISCKDLKIVHTHNSPPFFPFCSHSIKSPNSCLHTQPICSTVFMHIGARCRGTENRNRLWFSTIWQLLSPWFSSPSYLIVSGTAAVGVADLFYLPAYNCVSWVHHMITKMRMREKKCSSIRTMSFQ